MRQIDVQKLCDEARFRKFHLLLLFWCALIIIFDGYDLAVVGIALPSIMSDMGVQATSAGFMVSSALLGMMIGAVFLGTIADKIGRVPAIVICLLLFSVFTAAAGFTKDPLTFGIARFLAGLGIGGVMPNVVAQMTEYSPRKIRSTMVTLMFSGYSVGGMLAALVGKAMIVRYGWQSVFIAAGLPALLAPVILKYMPESLGFLVRNGRSETLAKILPRIEPAYVPQQADSFSLSEREPAPGSTSGSTIGRLFAEGRGMSTVMLWIAFFMCLFMVYALSSWLTKLMAGAGHSLGSALTFVLVLNFGAMIGAIGGGWLADRFNIKYVLIAMYALAAVSISLLGVKVPVGVLFFLVGLAGASTIGTQIVTYAFAGQFYPTAIRSTGIGWASGVGRSGAILAPIVIGFLVAKALPLQQNFVAIAIPGVIAMLAVCLINVRRPRQDHRVVAAPKADLA
ncbi:major facilitator transporter [Caballeronia cordobensis]|uniref:Major facilitator transporter n=1 Tax=Caballeronia cordobensis TaxID=1353886 RepID=A0A158FXU8_CABCO|nr:MFS transporter [Caballeronia cordobensis]SAL24441.1 major facilitator transporter [Caballeronia cordobensis]